MSQRHKILVVAGLVLSEDRILISKRQASQAMPLYWEFPGGKVKKGETPQAALKRELIEELGIEVQIGSLYEVLQTQNESADISLHFYGAQMIRQQTPSCIEVASWTWATKDELHRYRFLPADDVLLKRLSREGLQALKIA